jgi:hypothetical protein
MTWHVLHADRRKVLNGRGDGHAAWLRLGVQRWGQVAD